MRTNLKVYIRGIFLTFLLLAAHVDRVCAQNLPSIPHTTDLQVQLAEAKSALAGASPEEQSEWYNALGLIYAQGGWYEDAFMQFQLAEDKHKGDVCDQTAIVFKAKLAQLAKSQASSSDLPKIREAQICTKQLLEPRYSGWVSAIEGQIAQSQGNFSRAFELYFDALDELHEDSSLIKSYVNLNIASNLIWVGKHAYAKYFLEQAQEIEEKQAGVWYVEWLLLNAQVAMASNQKELAIQQISKAKEVSTQLNTTYWNARAVLISAYVYLKSGELDKVHAIVNELEGQLEPQQFPDMEPQLVLLKLELASEEKRAADAMALARFLTEDESMHQVLHPAFEARAYRILAGFLESTGQHELALQSQSAYSDLSEEMSKTGAFREFEFLRNAFESSSKVKRDIVQQAENQISYQEQRNQQILKYAALVALLVLSILLILLYRQIQIKQNANAELEQRSSLINKQNQELRKMNSVLEESRQQAEAGSIAKSNFLAVTSHEIRTPMNGIMGMASLLLESSLDEEQTKYVETIQTSSENLLTILNDILDFSKIEAGKMNIESTMIDLEKLLDEVMIIFSKQAKDKNIQLDKFIGNAMIHNFKGDVLRIRQVLINLVSNAIKFTENGKVKIVVELDELLRAQTDDSRIAKLKFAVKDNGIGISEEKQKKIFESFEQEDSSTSRKYGGIGLGLSISKKLVELMGGEIGLTSEKGRGTTFYFTLNVEIPQEIAKKKVELNIHEDGSKTELGSEKISQKHPLRILVAEDNPFNKLFIDKLFEKFGYTDYLHAENGIEVMDLLEEQDVDLILMDIQMPEMDGMEATQKIIEKYGDQRPVIIALTADANDSSKDQYLSAGMDGFLSKPFKADDLQAMLVEQSQKIQVKA